MRKLTILEYISLDGIVQAPGGPDEDRDGGFAHGGWSAPFDDPVLDEAVSTAHSAPFDLLLGRRTYDIWSGHWPHAPASPIADAFNTATKFVVTHRPKSLAWGPAEGLGLRDQAARGVEHQALPVEYEFVIAAHQVAVNHRPARLQREACEHGVARPVLADMPG